MRKALGVRAALSAHLNHIQMAKAAPSKKTAKAAKTASTGGKKKAHRKGKETFNSYIHKVLKQVHPGAFARLSRPRARAQRAPGAPCPPEPHCPMSDPVGGGGEGLRGARGGPPRFVLPADFFT